MIKNTLRLFTTTRKRLDRNPSNPLIDFIESIVKTNGPISIAQYIRLALTHPTHGYYNRRDIIGKGGDFVTSPEISQIFGEMVGVWLISQLSKSTKKYNFVEFGPGNGTLLADVLRTWNSFPEISSKINSITLIEKSSSMILKQINTLCSVNNTYISSDRSNMHWKSIPIEWKEDYELLNDHHPPVCVAHEFFDALPIHQFIRKDDKLHEIMIDVDSSSRTKNLRFVIGPCNSPAVVAYHTEFSFEFKNMQENSTREWSPESGHLLSTVAERMTRHEDGIFLAVDYGKHSGIDHSFRAIKDNSFCHPLTEPGFHDVTADVDFSYLTKIASKFADIKTYPLITQQQFLKRMGSDIRNEVLLKKSLPDSRTAIKDAYKRLVSDSQMGLIYKFWLMKHKKNNGDSYPFY